jgi:hypothetical protein
MPVGLSLSWIENYAAIVQPGQTVTVPWFIEDTGDEPMSVNSDVLIV